MKGKWIWDSENARKNDWVVFEQKFTAKEPARQACLSVAVDSKYHLWLNGELIVTDGGLYRESKPGMGWFDRVPLTGVQNGENRLVFLVWFQGNGGRCSTTSGRGGLWFECEAYGFASSSETLCARETAYGETGEPYPSCLYSGGNIGYDASKAIFNPYTMEISGLHQSTEYGEMGGSPWGYHLERPVPLMAFEDAVDAEYERTGEKLYKVRLPRCMHVNPCFEVEASGGEIIDVRSDRYTVRGGPDDDRNVYNGHRTEYICRAGVQKFESMDWMSAEELLFSVPSGVRILSLGYRRSGYNHQMKVPVVDDPDLQILLEKCARTLDVCMRDGFMDCPDRERGQWIGDVSVQAPQVFYAGDENSARLLRKAIRDFIELRKGDRLVGNVPGDDFSELPSQSLNAISELGMISEYINHTHDAEIEKLCYRPIVRYLKLWQTDERGLVIPRRGDWTWHDHLSNIDVPVLENCWYYSALKFALRLSRDLNDEKGRAFLEERKKSIGDAFDKAFLRNEVYASEEGWVDERANALAVLVGLADLEDKSRIRNILVSTMNCTPYFENYVLSALCEMGQREDAYYRMMTRYYAQIRSPYSTIGEDFCILGTHNHAWSGGPLTIVCRYFPEKIKGWKKLDAPN